MLELFEKIAEKIITKEDLIFFLEELNLAKEFLFKEINLFLSEKLKGKVSEDFQKFVEELERNSIISKDPEKNKFFFENLKNYLLKLPQIKIEIAFSPSRQFIEKLSFWFKNNLKEKLILDLISNPEIVGGVIIEYRGKYLNYSLAKKINEILKI